MTSSHANPMVTADTAEHPDHRGAFITVFVVLALLTVVEVFIPHIYASPWDQHLKMILLCTLAVGKATLVGLFFMHLKWEKPWLKYIALLPVYMGVFTILLLVETVYRAPGA